MKRRFVFSGVVVLLLMAALASTALAALPGSGWWVFYQIQNVSNTSGTLTMTAYETEADGSAGTTIGSQAFNIGAGKALAFNPGLPPTYPSGDRIGFSQELPSGFQGAAVISSDVNVVAVAQVGNNKVGTVGVDGGTATAFYQGIGGGTASTEVNFPTAKNNFVGQTTTFYVQAAGSDANVTITYMMNDGNTYSQNATIQANHMYVFSPDNANVPDSNCNPTSAATSPCLGAARVNSQSGSIVGVVVEHPDSGSPATYALSTRGFTSADEDTTIYAPTIKNQFFNATTGWSVQNVGNAQTTVNVTFTVTNLDSTAPGTVQIGDTFTDSEVVQPGEAVVFSRFRNNLGGMPQGVYAAGVATANQPLVGSVNETNDGARIGGNAKAVYASFPQNGATNKVALPIEKEMFAGNTTGVTVVNAGNAPTRFIATYTDAAGVARTFQTVSTNIQPGEAVPFFTVFNNLGNRFQIVSGFSSFSELENTKNSVIIESSNGEEIVALAQESDRVNRVLDIKNYESFPLSE